VDLGDGSIREGRQVEYEYAPAASGMFTICLTVKNDAGYVHTAREAVCIGPAFRRGDVNDDRRIDIADAICTIVYLFGDAAAPAAVSVARCPDTADANDDGTIDIGDPVKVLGHLFAQRGPLPEPFAACGGDPTADGLGCTDHAACGK